MFYQVMQNMLFIAVRFFETQSSRYCCYGNCAAGSKPI